MNDFHTAHSLLYLVNTWRFVFGPDVLVSNPWTGVAVQGRPGRGWGLPHIPDAHMGRQDVEQLGQIPCSIYEEMRVSLREVCRKWHVELRLCGLSDDESPQERPARVAINLPIEQLPILLEQLAQVRDSCVKRGLLGCESPGEIVVMDRGESVVLQDRYRYRGQRGRRHPRMQVRYSVICQPLATAQAARSTILQGEFRDLSAGGAQIWLPCRLELGQQVEIAGMIDGQPFRARAEVVGASVQVKKGLIGEQVRHSLKWLTYNAAAADILTMTLVQPAGGNSTQSGSLPGPETSRKHVPAILAGHNDPRGAAEDVEVPLTGIPRYSRETDS